MQLTIPITLSQVALKISKISIKMFSWRFTLIKHYRAPLCYVSLLLMLLLLIIRYLFIFPLSNPEPPTFPRWPGEMQGKEPWEQMRPGPGARQQLPRMEKTYSLSFPCSSHRQQTLSECLCARRYGYKSQQKSVILPRWGRGVEWLPSQGGVS